MKSKPISLIGHCMVDYALASSLLIFPTVLGLPHNVRKLYTWEALIIMGYVSITDHPASIRPLIPIKAHASMDPFNVAGFTLQTFLNVFRKNKKATAFNIAFTALSGLAVLLTDWNHTYK